MLTPPPRLYWHPLPKFKILENTLVLCDWSIQSDIIREKLLLATFLLSAPSIARLFPRIVQSVS